MDNVLTRKLHRLSPLTEGDRAVLSSALQKLRTFDSGVEILKEGSADIDVHVIVTGMACRISTVSNLDYQIVRYFLPGDLCNLQGMISERSDATIRALTACTVCIINRSTISQWMRRPFLAKALWCAAIADERLLSAGLTNIASRRAEQRIAHFICEMFYRLDDVGLVADNSFHLPINQIELGRTLGLSTVHVNRALSNIRNRNLIKFKRNQITILDLQYLISFCGFDRRYLCHQPPKVEPDGFSVQGDARVAAEAADTTDEASETKASKPLSEIFGLTPNAHDQLRDKRSS